LRRLSAFSPVTTTSHNGINFADTVFLIASHYGIDFAVELLHDAATDSPATIHAGGFI
jgi:hypothetical protein